MPSVPALPYLSVERPSVVARQRLPELPISAPPPPPRACVCSVLFTREIHMQPEGGRHI